jgi:hypothetical protein
MTISLDRRRKKDRRQHLDRRQGAERRNEFDRREQMLPFDVPEQRQGDDRRSGYDRRHQDDRRKGDDRRRGSNLANFLYGDSMWGTFRLLAILLLSTIYLLMTGYLFETVDTQTTVNAWLQRPLTGLFLLWLPPFLRHFLAFIFDSQVLRYIIAPLGACLFILLLGTRYLQDIYNLQSFFRSLRYLAASIFGLGYFRMRVVGGEKILKEGEDNILDTIGGPGYLIIEPGFAVLMERGGGNLPVLHDGRYFIRRFERIREIVNLSDQSGTIETISAMTKDGIPLLVKDVSFHYRLLLRSQVEQPVVRSTKEPYPFSEKAIRDMAFNRSVNKDGLMSWSKAVSNTISTTITRYISRNTINHLIAPRNSEKSPREDIQDEFRSNSVIASLNMIGTELIWLDVGRFEFPKDFDVVVQELVKFWQTRWISDASLTRAHGEATRLAYEELGRAEAQADLLNSIVAGLDEIGLTDDHRQNLRNLILIRTAQILDGMTQKNRQIDQKNNGIPPKGTESEAK